MFTADVSLAVGFGSEDHRTFGTLEGFLAGVSQHVSMKRTGPRKPPLAVRTRNTIGRIGVRTSFLAVSAFDSARRMGGGWLGLRSVSAGLRWVLRANLFQILFKFLRVSRVDQVGDAGQIQGRFSIGAFFQLGGAGRIIEGRQRGEIGRCQTFVA